MLGKQAVNRGAGTETMTDHAMNVRSEMDVGGADMRPAVDGFSGASRLFCSCKVCRMWHGKLPSPTAVANAFFRLELL